MMLRRPARLLAAVLLVAAPSLVLSPGQPAYAASAVTKTKTVQRFYVQPDGSTKVVDTRTVSVSVSQTTGLRSLQLVHVTWSGARPTAGLVADPNSDLGQNEEYPMVLLECRGIDSATAPAAQRLSQRTCWTQFADERFYYGYDTFPAWRSDAQATTQERSDVVGAPDPTKLPAECALTLLGSLTQRWVPYDGVGGTYQGGPFGCAGQAPEAAPANLSSLTLPSNETFGTTGLDGKGQADFDIFTGEDHNSLGCSQTVPCSLVAVPVMGIDCDSAGLRLPAADRRTGDDLLDAQQNCETDGQYKPGQQLAPGISGQDAVDGRLWWSASNWNNRITIPLTFAQPDNACSVTNQKSPVSLYGSELMAQATIQWAPAFCLNPALFSFNHVQTPEPQAANLLNQGNIEAAFVSRPPDGGFTRPVVTAPVAVTGFGIAFTVDDADGRTVQTLRLNARLLAKLLTESYPSLPLIRDSHPGLGNNPYNITFDPEFTALNPNIPQKLRDAASTLLSLNTSSDVMDALTSYIDSDPDARAFLDGKPDPWGMVVNPAYKGIALPVDTWPLLDSYTANYTFDFNPCLYLDPVPYLPLVAAPTGRLFAIAQDMQFAIAQTQTSCVLPDPNGTTAGARLQASGRQQVGARCMLGVVSLADASRDGLRLAALNSQGSTYVAPGSDSLRAAVGLLKPDKAQRLWDLSASTLRTSSQAVNAYPGTMVVYAAVPLSGLPPQDSAEYAKLLRFAAGAGQQAGSGVGDLPSGYLPMTAANGLGSLVEYTDRAANAVNAQQGGTVPLDPPPPTHPTPAPSTSSAPPPSTTTTTPPPVTTPVAPPTTTVPPVIVPTSPSSGLTPTPSHSPSTPLTVTAIPPATSAAPVAYTSALDVGKGGLALPALLVVLAAAVVSALVVRLRGQGGHR
ncbi:MAG: hypothetical protein ACTHMS_09450 [Jatrophihabitans sp.]|uniref:hypothetical protein n=1 Tax=Jatrophihabitans sp. TaxID=1932789 RepID=UPI003F815E58